MDATLTRSDIPDALFATDNAWGVPVLDLSLQADYVHLPVRTWGSVKRNQVMPGTWHFYTEDYRYEALWSDPSALLNSRCVAMVEPNFTTSEQMARAVALYQVYRKRWIARLCQSVGIKVFVDLNVAPDWYDLNLYGVPRGWKAWMTRGYADRLDYLDLEYRIACDHAGTEEVLFAVYGGGMEVFERCARLGVIYVPETCDVRKGKFLPNGC